MAASPRGSCAQPPNSSTDEAKAKISLVAIVSSKV
jgi:hypothetical protein